MGRRSCDRWGAAIVLLALLWPRAAVAESREPPHPSFANKLTLAYYHFSSGVGGADVNLRHTFRSSTAWIGAYQETGHFNQARVGYEYDFHRDWLTLVPSVQAATHGFVGTTVYAEAGRRLFAIGGTGITNQRPYWNLGFDPNDYIQFGVGLRDRGGNSLNVYAIRDSRLGTGQTNTHLFYRRYVNEAWRLSVDLVNERGVGEGGVDLNGWAVSVDLNWREWFVRVAEDPHVNYTLDRQVRIAGGIRF